MSTLTVEAPTDFIQQALATFDESRHAIATVQEYGNLTVAEHGIGQVTEAHKVVKKLRIDVDKRRKELNEGALEYQRAVNAEAKRLTAEVEPIEGKLGAERDNYEAEKEREKEAKKAEKRAALQGRLNRLIAAGVSVKVEDVEAMDDGFFEAFLANESEKAAAAKAETARIETERQSEIARQHEELRAEREKLEADRKAAEATIAAERKVAQKQAEELRLKQVAEREEIRQQQEAMLKQQNELKAKLHAEREAEAAREAKARLETAKAEKEAKLAALQPDIDKAKAFGVSLVTDAADELSRIGNPWWSDRAKRLIECLCGDLVNIVASGSSRD